MSAIEEDRSDFQDSEQGTSTAVAHGLAGERSLLNRRCQVTLARCSEQSTEGNTRLPVT